MPCVPAAILAVNVKPQRLSRDECLMETVPVSCTSDSLEWGCVVYTKSGAADALKKTGGPLPIILQHVVVDSSRVTEAPNASEVMVWGSDQKGRFIRCAVCIPRFPDFAGQMGDTDIELDSNTISAVLPVLASRRRFLSTLVLLLGRIRGGLDRKFGAANNLVTHLLSCCDAHTVASSSSGAGAADLCGIHSLASFKASGCPCLQRQTFAEWLHTPCVPGAGVVTIKRDVNYEFPEDFAAFRHAYKHILLHSLLSSRIHVRVNGIASEGHLYKMPGAAGYKRHAIWVAPLPLPKVDGMTPWQIWKLGAVHVIMGASSVGHTRLHIQPPTKVSGDVVGLILNYVGHQEAVYESWSAAQRFGGPYPVAVDIVFGGRSVSEGSLRNPLSIPHDALSSAQAEFLCDIECSCVPRLFHGVPGCGKTEMLPHDTSVP